MRISDVAVGEGAPLALISGLNVIESEAAALECAKMVREIAEA
jgi:3-deoxy-D-manno-octulosonic acid (KDO) 8-phosphate synthase